jgi:hypothetical protein
MFFILHTEKSPNLSTRAAPGGAHRFPRAPAG